MREAKCLIPALSFRLQPLTCPRCSSYTEPHGKGIASPPKYHKKGEKNGARSGLFMFPHQQRFSAAMMHSGAHHAIRKKENKTDAHYNKTRVFVHDVTSEQKGITREPKGMTETGEKVEGKNASNYRPASMLIFSYL